MKSIYETNLFKDQFNNSTVAQKRSTGGPFMASPLKKGNKKATTSNRDDIVD